MGGRLLAYLVIGLWFLVGPGEAEAQSVRVTSGEHDGFSRIVLQFPGPVDWQVTRTGGGYALSVPGTRPRYDLTDVFRLIPRDRLAAIFADPETGVLNLNVACACHALPFELRPGLVVLDIRDGPPPQGSSFEQTTAGQITPPLQASKPRRPVPRPTARQEARVRLAADGGDGLDWRSDLRNAARVRPSTGVPIVRTNDLDAAREALIRQLGRGAAEGVVDFREALAPVPAPFRRPAADLDRHLTIGAEPGLDVDAGRRVPGMLTPEGGVCFTDEALDLAAWAQDGDVASTMGRVRSTMLGEFDQPDEAATSAAIRYFLYLGFGAEARELIRHFAPDSTDRAMWLALADLFDGEPVAQNPFEGMQICDSAAALWAVLAAGVPPAEREIDRAAVFRSFSALPVHLRHHIGPELAGLFREAGDLAGAGTLRDALLRAPGEIRAEVRLMEADLQLAREGATMAQPLLEPLIAGSGLTAIEATVRLITAQVSKGEIVEDSLITTAEAFLHEARGSERSASIAEALALGLASQARVTEALSLPDLSEGTRRRVWDIFSAQADDSSLLSATVGVKPEEIQSIGQSTRLVIAARLNGLGLFRPAGDWLAGPMDPAFRTARARANAGLRDWQGVLADIAGLEGEEAMQLRAEALAALNDPEVLDLLSRLDAPEARLTAARRLGAWPELTDAPASDPWAAAARLIALDGPATFQTGRPPVQPNSGSFAETDQQQGEPVVQPLESARQRIAESRAARDLIEALLVMSRDDADR